MREKIFILTTRVFLPLAFIGILSLVAFYSCNRPGGFEYFWFWVAVGFPFGFRHMGLILIPRGGNMAATLFIVAIQMIAGGIIGGFVAVATIVKAFATLIRVMSGNTALSA